MSRYFVTMPQLGESVTEGTISRWLVSAGDRVAEFDAMVEINTDKVDAEVPAPVTGVLTEILAPEGAVVPVGADIAGMEEECRRRDRISGGRRGAGGSNAPGRRSRPTRHAGSGCSHSANAGVHRSRASDTPCANRIIPTAIAGWG